MDFQQLVFHYAAGGGDADEFSGVFADEGASGGGCCGDASDVALASDSPTKR